jgi:hypothetical protein
MRKPIALVGDEGGQYRQRRRIRTANVAQKPDQQTQLVHAVHDQIRGGKMLRPDRQVRCQVVQVIRYKIAGILEQLLAGQPGSDSPDRLLTGQQQGNATDQFEHAIQPLEQDANLECPMGESGKTGRRALFH